MITRILAAFALICGVAGVVLLIVAGARAHPAPLPRPWLKGALCVHGNEGSWRDGGGPYYGGMQMDLAFQRKWGRELLRRKGTADRWTPHEQLHVSHRAWRVLGWSPWPKARRICGL